MHKHLCRVLLGVFGAALLAGCAGAPQAEAPTSAPAPTAAAAPTTASAAPTGAPAATVAGTPTEADIKASIQQTLDLYAQAYGENKPNLLKQTVDQTNAPFRRLIQTRFETFQQSIFAGKLSFNYKVKTITPRDHGFILAQVEREGGAVADWLFRQVKGKWLLSEPTEEQLGKREKIESEHFTFYTYPWADDINPTLIKLMENARSTALERLGKVPDKKANIYIKPIFGIGSPENPNAAAYYDLGSTRTGVDRIVIFAPHSFSFGFYDPAGWEADFQGTLTHEYTHLVNNRSFTPIARETDWMSEGLAEFVSDNPRANEVHEAVSSDKIIPIIDTSGQVNKQDLEHLSILEKDRSLAYGLAYSLVAYVNEKYGGMDGYWKLVQAFDKEQNFDKALQQAFGVTYEQFDKDWRAWLKTKYG
jgi:hypothetical protein